MKYREVKDTFQLVPQPGILEREGYIKSDLNPETSGVEDSKADSKV